MSTIELHDTKVDDALVTILRKKTPAERLAIAHRMWTHGRKLILNVVQQKHPDWSATELEREAARRISHGAV